jgi:hypothetical protein
VKVAFDPAKFELAPGQQSVVTVTVPIDAELVEGVAYSGEFAIDGMDGFAVPAVLRRQHRVDASPIDRVSEEQAKKAGTTRTKAARKAPAKKARRKTSDARKKT